MSSIAEDLIARLKTVQGVAAVFDAVPVGYSVTASPVLEIQHVSSVPETAINGEMAGRTERWQVSVRGLKLSTVRTVAEGVINALHGYSTDRIASCEFESWPGTMSEQGAQFHAPIDFTLMT